MSDNPLTMQFYNSMIQTRDLEKASRFYEEILGLNCVFNDPGLRYSAFIPRQGNPQRLTVREIFEDEVFVPSRFRGPCPSWLSDNLDADWNELRRRGVDVEPIVAIRKGARAFCFRDPDGNEFSVMQFMPE